MKQKLFLSSWAIVLFLWVFATPVSAQDPSFLTLRLSSSKPFYKPSEMFNMSMFMSNSLPASVKVGVIFELHGRSGLTGEMDTPLIYRKIWPRYSFPPGASELKITKSISSLRLSEGAYPIKVSLMQGGQVINSVSSMLVVLDEHPAQEFFPVALVLVWPLHDRAHFDHRGIYLDNKIAEDSRTDVNAPGLYYRHLSAISPYSGLQVTMAVTPLLMEQMADMKDGYRVATNGKIESKTESSQEVKDVSAVFDRLAELFSSKQISLLPAPYSLASLSFLADNGWDVDGRLQISRGLDTLNNALELSGGQESLALPNFTLSADSIAYLAEEGIQNTILDEGLFRRLLPQETEDVYKAYRLQDSEGNRISAVFRDSKASEALGIDSSDEAVQRLMGRLAEIYLSQPQRQKIVVAAADIRAKPSQELLGNLYGALQASWIRTVTLREAIELAPPASKPLMMLDSPIEEGYLSGEYRKRLSESRRLYRLFSQAVEANNSIRKRLERELLIAEGWDWTSSFDLKIINLGLDFVRDIEDTVKQELGKVEVVSGDKIMLSSLQGKIPVAVFNHANYRLKMKIGVDGKDFSFPSGRTKSVVVEPKENLFSFNLAAARPGTFPLKVVILRDSETIDEATFVIKATSLSRTISLVLGLIALGVASYFSVRFGIRARRRDN